MLVQIEVTWQIVQGGGFNAFGTYGGSGTAFDTDTHTIVPYYGTMSGSYITFGPPDPVHTAAGAVLWFECADDFTKTSWIYDGSGGFTTEEVANSPDCGWTPPAAALTCNLGTASVTQTPTGQGMTLKLLFAGTLNGQAWYRLDGGPEQTSPTFLKVPVGEHVLAVRDDGLADCTRTVKVEVKATPTEPAAPVGAQGVDFVAQPLWYPVTGVPAGALVELELWAERTHGAADYALVLPLRKYADQAGRVSFRLDTLLYPLLAPFEPTPGLATTVCTRNLVNYFVRTASTAPGQEAVKAVSPLRTALRGGLPAEWQATNYFAFRLSPAFALPPFLSWQPLGAGTYAAGEAKPIVAGQPEWLFFLCPLALADAQLRIRRAYFLDQASAPVQEFEAVTRPEGGWAQRLLAIPLRATRPGVVSQRVQVETAAGEVVSPEACYTFGPASPRTRYLLFTNSLGGVDTLRCEGRLDATLEATASSVERPARYGAGSPAADSQVSEVVASRKLRLATGWLSPAELDWLQELVLAREAWQQVGQQLRPLELAKRSLATYSDEPTLRGLLLDFDYAYAPTAYAPSPYA